MSLSVFNLPLCHLYLPFHLVLRPISRSCRLLEFYPSRASSNNDIPTSTSLKQQQALT